MKCVICSRVTGHYIEIYLKWRARDDGQAADDAYYEFRATALLKYSIDMPDISFISTLFVALN